MVSSRTVQRRTANAKLEKGRLASATAWAAWLDMWQVCSALADGTADKEEEAAWRLAAEEARVIFEMHPKPAQTIAVTEALRLALVAGRRRKAGGIQHGGN